MRILAHAGYTHSKPYIEISEDNKLARFIISAQPLTCVFDTSERYCTGWHDLASGQSHTCPDQAIINSTYTQCPACQRRTGFNPAFYHAKSVSNQQAKRNLEPHILYLAYFAPDTIKVGISHAARGVSRLQEQGARAALILQTYPTALIARQYEEKIARMDGVSEHLSSRKKRALWHSPYSVNVAKRTLIDSADKARQQLAISFSTQSFHDFEATYIFGGSIDLGSVEFVDSLGKISGDVVACVGTELIARNDDRLIALNLKNFLGYQVVMNDSIQPIELPPLQPTLF